MKDHSDEWEAAVILLLTQQPIGALLKIFRIDVDKLTSLGEGLDDKSGQPQASFFVSFSKSAVRAIFMSVVQFPLVTCNIWEAVRQRHLFVDALKRTELCPFQS